VLAQVFDYALNTAQVNLAHVLETRRAIELQTAQLAARYATDEQRKQLRELVAQMRSAGNSSNHARRIAADSAIHTLIAEASANPLNSLLLGALRSPLEASAAMHLDESRSEKELIRVVDAHEALVDRICVGDVMGASSAMSYHFDLAMVHVQRHGDDAADDQAASTAPSAGDPMPNSS
jgi:GntR family transcriptional repressor for pyruvate dehydrogenase complex